MEVASSTEIVSAIASSTGDLIGSSFPLLYLFLGMVIAFFGIFVIARAVKRPFKGRL